MATLVWTRYSLTNEKAPVGEIEYQELHRVAPGEMTEMLRGLRKERCGEFWRSEKRRVIAAAAIPVGLALVWIPWERTGCSAAVAVGAMMVGGLLAGIGVLSVLGAGFSAASFYFAFRQECHVLQRAHGLANAAATYGDYCQAHALALAAKPRVSGFTMIAFVFVVLGLATGPVGGLPAILFGNVGRRKESAAPPASKLSAVAMILGAIETIAGIAFYVFVIRGG
jgi:hypothetical protein